MVTSVRWKHGAAHDLVLQEFWDSWLLEKAPSARWAHGAARARDTCRATSAGASKQYHDEKVWYQPTYSNTGLFQRDRFYELVCAEHKSIFYFCYKKARIYVIFLV